MRFTFFAGYSQLQVQAQTHNTHTHTHSHSLWNTARLDLAPEWLHHAPHTRGLHGPAGSAGSAGSRAQTCGGTRAHDGASWDRCRKEITFLSFGTIIGFGSPYIWSLPRIPLKGYSKQTTNDLVLCCINAIYSLCWVLCSYKSKHRHTRSHTHTHPHCHFGTQLGWIWPQNGFTTALCQT